jgi:hypothetical protein
MTKVLAVGSTRIECIAILLALVTLWLSRTLAHDPWLYQTLGVTTSLVINTSGFGVPVFAFLILVFAVGKGYISAWLRRPTLVFLGEVSFALYLIHTLYLLYRQQAPGVFAGLSDSVVYGLYWLVSLSLASMLHLLVEKPGQSLLRDGLGRRTRGGAGLQRYALLGGFVVLSGALVWLQPSTRSAYASSIQPVRTLLDHPVVFSNGYRLDQIEVLAADLRFVWTANGDASLAKRVAVHLLDETGKMTGQLDFAIETGYRSASNGEKWGNLVSMQGIDLTATRSLGVAVYDAGGLTKIIVGSEDTADWNESRLIVPLQKDLSRTFASTITPAEIVGSWKAGEGIAHVREDSDGNLSLKTEAGLLGRGKITDGGILVTDWGVEGRLRTDGTAIVWSNGFQWSK